MDHVNGLDVSDFQGSVDWHAVKSAGYSFAYAKATQGTGNVQTTFAANIKGIAEAGMLSGAYHFLDWTVSGTAQAEHFLSVYTPKSGDLPPMLDCEAFTANASDTTAIIAQFLERIEPHLGGAKMLLYTFYGAIESQDFVTADFSGHPLWIAAYNDDPEPPTPPQTWKAATMWQHSDGSNLPGVPGISGGVDRDWFCGTEEALRALTLKL